MVWQTIKAVYGYVVDIDSLENPPENLFEECDDGYKYINHGAIANMFENKLNCVPTVTSNMNYTSSENNELLKIFSSMNEDDIEVEKKQINNILIKKFINIWNAEKHTIPEFKHYKDKSGINHYKLLHTFSCCSNSQSKYVIIGATFDEMDRNLFLDTKFDEICENVFNIPTKIQDIGDLFFQHDHKNKSSPKISEDDEYIAKICSLPNVRKNQLLNPNTSIETYVKSLGLKYPSILKNNPECYLMLDDCIWCT